MKLSKSAAERIAYEPQWHYRDAESTIIRMAEEALERPSNSAWRDETLWETHTLMFAYSSLADDLIGESNYHRILEDLTAEFPGDDRVEASGFGHWTYSHYHAIKIRVLNKRGRITPEFAVAATIRAGLDDYPLYDEWDYSTREYDAFHTALADEIRWASRDVELTDEDAARITEYVGEHHYGTDEPGWVDPDWITEAATALDIRLTDDDDN